MDVCGVFPFVAFIYYGVGGFAGYVVASGWQASDLACVWTKYWDYYVVVCVDEGCCSFSFWSSMWPWFFKVRSCVRSV